MRILILEDERATAQLLGMLLTTSGHTVEHALDGTEGLKQLRAAPCDLVISDVQMVPMDGFGFLAIARTEFPRLLVVLASACADLHARVEKQPHKPFDVVHKPFRIEEIRRVLARATEALSIQAGIAQASVPAGKGAGAEPSEHVSERLAGLLPGTPFAPVRANLARVMRQPGNALIVAERGLIGPEVLNLWRESSPQPKAPWQVVSIDQDPSAAQAALFGPGEEAGPAVVAARGGTLVLLNLDALTSVDQARLASHLRGPPPTRIVVTLRRDPDTLLDEGLIDEALYFRFSTGAVLIPSLVDFDEHVDALFVEMLRATPGFSFGATDVQIEPSALTALRGYRWPENFVELRAVAVWVSSRMRSPRVTLSQFPERFQHVRLYTLSEALAVAQRDHLQRALRINPSSVEAALALGLSTEDFARGLSLGNPNLFTVGNPVPAGSEKSDVSEESTQRSGGFLIVAPDERLRHSLDAHLAGMGLEARLAVDGLQAIAQLMLAPVLPRFALLSGSSAPFELSELIEQLRRLAPDLIVATLGADEEIENTHSFPMLESMDILPVILARLLEAKAPEVPARPALKLRH